MHSFSRVVRRHEHEAILQNPAAWDPIYRAELEASRAFHNGLRSRRGYSPVSATISRRPTQRRPPSDPFEDFQLDTGSSSLPPSLLHDDELEELRSNMPGRSRHASFVSDASEHLSYEEPSTLEVDLTALPLSISFDSWDGAGVLLSPKSGEYPALTSCTPESLFGSHQEDSSPSLEKLRGVKADMK